jgi:hypothetical protein
MFERLDSGSLFYSIFFMLLGLYLAYFWPRSIQRKIDEGEASSEIENLAKWLRPVGIFFFLYCVVELLFKIWAQSKS